jgi:hypothetical protein
MNELCYRCGDREAKVKIGGKYLCASCGINELINRVRKGNRPDNIDYNLLLIPDFLEDIEDVIKTILSKIYKNIKINSKKILINHNDINFILWKYMTFINDQEIKVIITPFTADFFAAYLIKSSITGKFNYINMYKQVFKNYKYIFYQPLYNITLNELRVFKNINKKNTGDQIFDYILKWLINNFQDNEEIFHSFRNSLAHIINTLRGHECKICNALITNGEYCEFCLNPLAFSFQKE